MPERLIIANTSPLLYLQLVGCLDVLRALYGVVVVPPAVQTELAHLVPARRLSRLLDGFRPAREGGGGGWA